MAKAPKPTGGGAAKKKVAPITPGAKQRLRDSGAIKLRKAIGRVEGHPVTEAVLSSLGRGSAKGWRLLACHSAEEYHEASTKTAVAYIAADKSLAKLGAHGKDAADKTRLGMLAVLRMIDTLVDSMKNPGTPAGTPPRTTPTRDGSPTYVVNHRAKRSAPTLWRRSTSTRLA